MRINSQNVSPLRQMTLTLDRKLSQQVNSNVADNMLNSRQGKSVETVSQTGSIDTDIQRQQVLGDNAVQEQGSLAVSTIGLGTSALATTAETTADASDSFENIVNRTQTQVATTDTFGSLNKAMMADAAQIYEEIASLNTTTSASMNRSTDLQGPKMDQGEWDRLMKFLNSNFERNVVQQAGVAKIGMANQAAPQVLSLFG